MLSRLMLKVRNSIKYLFVFLRTEMQFAVKMNVTDCLPARVLTATAVYSVLKVVYSCEWLLGERE